MDPEKPEKTWSIPSRELLGQTVSGRNETETLEFVVNALLVAVRGGQGKLFTKFTNLFSTGATATDFGSSRGG